MRLTIARLRELLKNLQCFGIFASLVRRPCLTIVRAPNNQKSDQEKKWHPYHGVPINQFHLKKNLNYFLAAGCLSLGATGFFSSKSSSSSGVASAGFKFRAGTGGSTR